MHCGILAAGKGARLKSEGIITPKPLVKIGTETLVDRLVRIFIDNGATAISIIINEEEKELKDYWKDKYYPIPLNLIIKSTDNSFDSFRMLIRTLKTYPFCVTTVDTIFSEVEFGRYVTALKTTSTEALFPVTRFVHDEAPLYIKNNNYNRVISFSSEGFLGEDFVSGGIYGFTKDIQTYVEKAHLMKIKRMRNFQEFLLLQGVSIESYPFEKILDVDRKTDLDLALEFLKL
jgi:NDP-sugar pyrophosphorylase family protein